MRCDEMYDIIQLTEPSEESVNQTFDLNKI